MDDLGSIVEKAERASEQHSRDENKGLGRQVAHDEQRGDNCDEHHKAAHRGRALLYEVGLGPIVTHLLTDVTRLQELDPWRHEQHRNNDGNEHREEHQECRIFREDKG